MTLFKQIAAILLLPGIVIMALPVAILISTGTARVTETLVSPWNLLLFAAGLSLIGTGILLMVQTIRLFGNAGLGTLAPWEPPKRLVVRGIYRRLRNPMIVGVILILLGETAIAGSLPLLAYSLLVVLVNAIYIPLIEEPGLERRFGADFELYRQHVPRWRPRRTAWVPPWDDIK